MRKFHGRSALSSYTRNVSAFWKDRDWDNIMLVLFAFWEDHLVNHNAELHVLFGLL